MTRQSFKLYHLAVILRHETSLGIAVPVESLWTRSAVSYPWGFIIYDIFSVNTRFIP